MIRLFLALALPHTVRAYLSRVQQQLPTALPVRRTHPDGMHLTLHFLGTTPAAQVPALLAALTDLHARHAPAFELALAPAGAFPSRQRPLVLWQGVGGDLPALHRLHQAVLAAIGATPEARPFQPHVTLGRVRRDASRRQQNAVRQALADLPAPPALHWPAGPPYLYQSTLTPQGPRYMQLGPSGTNI